MNYLVETCLLLCVAPLLSGADKPPSNLASTSPPPVAAIAAPTPPASLPAGSVVYRTLTGREVQVTFTSEAPLERIVGKSNAVLGYAVAGPAENPAKLAGGEWVLPVRSLATGLPLRDEHLVGQAWLDAAAHPTIRFVLSRVDDIKEVKRGESFTTWSGTLVGTMTMHGVSRELKIPETRFSFLRESEQSKAVAPGDLLFLKCDYSVKLSDFGVRNSDVPGKVSDTVELSQMLRLSTKVPEKEESPGKGQDARPPAAGK